MQKTKYFLRILVGSILLTAMLAGSQAADNADVKLSVRPGSIEEPEITLSNCIPIRGEELEFRVVVRNSGRVKAGAVEAAFFISDRNGEKIALAGAQTRNRLAAGDTEILTTTWKPDKTGFYTFNVVIDPAKKVAGLDRSECKAKLEFPVVAKELTFIQSPPDRVVGKARKQRYTSAVVVCFQEQIPYWKNRGSKAVKFGLGFHMEFFKNKIKKSRETVVDDAAAYWGKAADEGFDGIYIDEFGEYPSEEGLENVRLAAKALVKLHKQRPNLKIYPANSGALLEALSIGYKYSDSMALLECYENFTTKYFGTQSFYKYLDQRIETARNTDLIYEPGRKHGAIMYLGVEGFFGGNIPAQIEDAVRYIKRKAPEMPGIGFFCLGNSYQWLEDTGLDKFMDRMCLKYYIMPVITVGENNIWLSNYAPKKGEDVEIFVRVFNSGAMDANDVRVKVHVRDLDSGKRVFSSPPISIKLGVGYVEPEISDKSKVYEMQDINGTLYPVFNSEKARFRPGWGISRIFIDRNRLKIKWTPTKAGDYQIEVKIIQSPEYTILDGFAVKSIAVSD